MGDMDMEGKKGFVDLWKIVEIEDVLKLLSEMVKYGCDPNIKTFSALIGGLCKEADWRKLGLYTVRWRRGNYFRMRIYTLCSLTVVAS
ncbi:hypothetical protein QJS10_CPB14g01505 [Acorus calamus]|uniref:Pentatricopeptide repeat-containing protein n=1 Tax=Acorus calamus TaxID=4465 RepID=A0AAV9DF95_ACOCL|nr:hypothetical protein QJS10_CPB14g01505 [Acorus calamus]